MDQRFELQTGTELFNGNELVVKGGLESQIALISGYPGSPVAEIFDITGSIKDLLKEKGIVSQIANNEALGAARLNGAQMAGLRAMAVMKNIGVHVASDALMISHFAGTDEKGGALVIIGDDPWCSSTQVPADSRFISSHIFLPLLEPSNHQEIKDWVRVGFELSEKADLYIGFLLVTNIADGGATIELNENRYPKINQRQKIHLNSRSVQASKRVVLPPDTPKAEVELLQVRFPKLLKLVREYGLNEIRYKPKTKSKHRPLGFVASGLVYSYLEHALYHLGMQGKIPILKLGMPYPLEPEIIAEFADCVDQVIVIEEKRGFIEDQIKRILSDNYREKKISRFVEVWGKEFPYGLEGISPSGGLHPSLLIEKLVPLFQEIKDWRGPSKPIQRLLKAELNAVKVTHTLEVAATPRPPTFCAGCPHRDSANVLKDIVDEFRDPKYMARQHKSGPVDIIFHGDIGCYSMVKYPPYDGLIHNLSGMGLGGGTGAGIDPFITNKQVLMVGDGTFYHSGMIAISDSIKNRQDITYLILDNKTTAMTGHQPSAGNDVDILGNPTFAQDIESIVRGMADGSAEVFCVRVNPAERVLYKKLVEKTILRDGVKVIIADKECGITLHRRLDRGRKAEIRKQGYLSEEVHVNITHEVCEDCRECTNKTACPGLIFTQTPYGSKVATDLSVCVEDLACARIKACPSFEKIIVRRKQKPKFATAVFRKDILPGQEADYPLVIDEGAIPLPEKKEPKGVWYGYVAGVGGMGTGVVSTLLSRAGMKEGYRVKFCNKKGLAIRNGGVFAHLSFTNEDIVISPLVPFGKAGLLLGLDVLEATRALDPKGKLQVGSKENTAAVINTAVTESALSLIGRTSFDTGDLDAKIKNLTKSQAHFSANFFALSEKLLGHRLYANLMMIGVAFQLGHLPLGLESLEWAMKRTLKSDDLQSNRLAFHIGRKMAVCPEEFNLPEPTLTFEQALKARIESLQNLHPRKPEKGAAIAREYKELVEQAVRYMSLDNETNMHLAIRTCDCLIYENMDYAKQYILLVTKVYEKDTDAMNYEATKAAIWNLHRVMVIKDEIYVAHLLTSPEKLARDKVKYNVNEAAGDEIHYIHLNRPSFPVLGFKIEFDANTRNWMLNLVKKMKFLRRLLPGWHKKERLFRDWYCNLLESFPPKENRDQRVYKAFVDIFKTPEAVKGYREIRYPTMENARRQVEEIFASLRATEPQKSPSPAATGAK